MKKLMLSAFALFIATNQSLWGFCGFYVAKADATLFNKASQVIYARSGDLSTITMASDYQGELKDFAMVVPVPVVLKENMIRVVNSAIFNTMDAYSAPRLAMYYDQAPCRKYLEENSMSRRKFASQANNEKSEMMLDSEVEYKVTIEAQYEVGEYDILILSARESSGLHTWLTDNGYKIPSGAKDVLDPYIKDNMKFFVAKVNTERMKFKSGKFLSPIQISFNSERFMLPIRLGMANANGDQDMIVYMLSQNGRIEVSNYRNSKIPSNQNVPLFVRDEFSSFYKDVFEQSYQENPASVFLEYSWDLSSSNYVKCDPCNSTPPMLQDLKTAGVNWLSSQTTRWGGSNYQGNVYFTRLHVRYNRKNFPQDLTFVETKNKERYQGRYVLHQPAQTYEDCDQNQAYYQEVVTRRYDEIYNLKKLTGRDINQYDFYVAEYENKLQREKKNDFLILPVIKDLWPFGLIPLLLLLLSIYFEKKKSYQIQKI